ncbi:MAG: IS1634 family transposase, partial [Blastocatellia bacterium]
ERLIVCFNPMLADERHRKRQSNRLSDAPKHRCVLLRSVARSVTLPPALQSCQALRYRHRGGSRFSYQRRTEAIQREADLDGIYVICGSRSKPVRRRHRALYKNLAQVERAFRTLKGIDLSIRPICLIAPKVAFARAYFHLAFGLHRRMASASSLGVAVVGNDEKIATERQHRDPVAPAKATDAARQEKATRVTEDAFPVHSFTTLLPELGSRCPHRCRLQSDPQSPPIIQDTDPIPIQVRALDLIRMFPLTAN